MTDLSNILAVDTSQVVAKNSTDTKAGASLDMTDFLTLMVAMFQNQSIDDTADTGEMMNMMVQMSVVEAITSISALISDSTTMTYAASLVGKEVTIGQRVGSSIIEISGTVDGTGMLNGEQVVFVNGESYALSEIMAVGKLPDLTGTSSAVSGSTSAVEETGESGEAENSGDDEVTQEVEESGAAEDAENAENAEDAGDEGSDDEGDEDLGGVTGA